MYYPHNEGPERGRVKRRRNFSHISTECLRGRGGVRRGSCSPVPAGDNCAGLPGQALAVAEVFEPGERLQGNSRPQPSCEVADAVSPQVDDTGAGRHRSDDDRPRGLV